MPPNRHRLLVVALALAGCGGGADTVPDDGGMMDAAPGPDMALGPIGLPGRFDATATIDGVDRTFILYVPASAVAAMANGPVPLLFALHGAGDAAEHFMTATALDKLADKSAFVLAVPDGYNNGWFVQTNEGWPGTDGQSNSVANDIHLLQYIIDTTAGGYRVDPKRYYVCGFSRGAAFTGLLAAASQNTKILAGKYTSPFAAYGISAGYNPFGNAGALDLAASGPKRPLWILHGDADQTVPFANGKAFADDLDAAAWPVTFTSVAGAGHNWLWRQAYGQSNDDLWSYFLANPLPGN